MSVAAPAAAPAVAYSPGYLRYVLALLMLVGVFNLVDRQLMSILAEPIRREFGLSDTRMGLLNGLGFALLYATVGLPLARLADRGSRTVLMSVSVALWSLLTALTALARDFPALLLARVGVGIGEAGFGPASNSMVADMFPPGRRATALSILLLSIPVGQLIGNAGGGWIAARYGWRAAFLWLGAPGLALAATVWLTVREPTRGQSEHILASGPAHAFGPALADLWRRRAFRYICAGAGLHTLVAYGLAAWLPAFFIRSHRMALGEVGLTVGLMIGVSGFCGTLIGGAAADTLGRRDVRWYAWWGALVVALVVPFGLAMYLAPTVAVSVAAGVVMFTLAASKNAASSAMVQDLAPLESRALAAAIYQLVSILIGLGLGPVLVGAISDRLQPSLGSESLRYALVILTFFNLGGTAFYGLASRTLREDLAVLRGGPAP